MSQYTNQETKPLDQEKPENLAISNRRKHVRIYYPEDCPPVFLPELVVNHRNCQVLDISEGGIRFAAINASLIKDGTINAMLRFTDGEVVEICGVVVRRNRNQVALMLEKGIPYCRIMSEQLRLRNLETKGVISYKETIRQ